MKKALITAIAILAGASAFGQTTTSKSNIEFQRYISKNVSYYSSFANEGVEGTVRVKVNVTANGFESVDVLSGVNSKIDKQVADLIMKTPSYIVAKLSNNKATTMVVPVKLIISEN